MPTTVDIEQPDPLHAYLRETRRIGPLETPRVTTLAGGVSNRTVLVERASGEAWVLKQALAKLRVAVDWFSDPARIEREAMGLRHLATLAPPGTTTPLVFEDPAAHLLAMQAVPRPHENWKAVLLAGRVEADHVRQFAELLASVHRNGWHRRDEMAVAFADRQFFESLRLEPYYAYAASQVPAAASFLTALVADTRGRRLTVVHGDYSPKNVLVRPAAAGNAGVPASGDRLVLLDHEVVHFGDPAFDAGFALTHLLSKAHHLPPHRAAFAAAADAFWEAYRAALGGGVPWAADLEPMVVRHTLGCLLARVAGRSPLEYLDAAARDRQRAAVLSLMTTPPATVAALVRAFVRRVG
jgi:5-methylthioribose kinase